MRLPSPLQASAEATGFEALLKTRRSCRGFLPKQVDRARIDDVLRAAQQTASWCNTQPWQVHVTEGAGTSRVAHELQTRMESEPAKPDFSFPSAYEGEYLARRRACGFQLYASVGVARGDIEGAERQRRANFSLFGAPHVAIVTSPATLGVYGAIDCGAYVQNFMLAATASGIATIAQASLASYADVLREVLEISPDRLVVCGISFGYADPDHPANNFRTSRASVDEAVRWISK